MKQNVLDRVADVWRRMLIPPIALIPVAGLMACSMPQQSDVRAERGDVQEAASRLFQTPGGSAPWEVFRLPGKTYAAFEPAQRTDRPALTVRADRSVSILRQRFDQPLSNVGQVFFSWKVDALPAGADLQDSSATDAPARVLLAFEGDRSRWTARAHRVSELSQLLTGEPLPYATLSYVWSPDDAVESVLINPRTDRIRKVVVESGTSHLGQWRDYRRDVRADFIRAFGEEPGPLVAVALMTDTDNTASKLQAWYGSMRLEAKTGQ